MPTYDTYPAVDGDYQFPPEIRQAFAASPELLVAISAAIAANPTVVSATAAAVTAELTARNLVEGNDPRLPTTVESVTSLYHLIYTDMVNRLALGIKKTGVVEIPVIESKKVIIQDAGSNEQYLNDLYLKGTLDNQQRLAEDALLKSGRVPDWILNRWKTRMDILLPSNIPPMDILLGGGQSNMGSTSDFIAPGVEFPEIDPRIYMWSPSTNQLINVRTASASNKASWIPRALYAFAEKYAKNQLQPGRAILMVNAGIGASGFSTTTIVPPPAGYYNVFSNGVPRTDTGSWEVGMTADPNNLYARMISMTLAAIAASPLGSAVKAFLWSQAESDYTTRTPDEYKTQLDLLIGSLRTDLNIATVVALIGSMVPDWVDGNGNKAGLQAALEDTPRRVERSAFAWGPENMPDWHSNIHWSAQGQLARGEIFWDAYLRAKWNVNTTEPIPPQNVIAKRIGPRVLVTWEHPPSAISSFKLEYKIDSGAWQEASLSGPVVRNATLDLGLTSSQIVTIRLSTTNTVGLSLPTREVQA